jgi:hypothetical protein
LTDGSIKWLGRFEEAQERYRGGETREADQRQLTQLANAAWAAGLSLLMAGRRADAAEWLRTAAYRYRESWDAGAPPDSWGRPIAAMKALLLAGDDASEAAGWALAAGAEQAESPIGRYAAALALLVLGLDDDAAAVVATLGEGFPEDVSSALGAVAAHDAAAFAEAAERVLRSFERRTDFLEDIPVADTALVLDLLALERGLEPRLRDSVRLP